ncbi:molybdopterin converting factor subunit 1 [Pelagibaculum spongiae]|uniref:Molybdopterin synthase sulfur carrier subunit n=1 Tax=Pelagibaculum spongiae TaxID=2080658 RepID=A0A2V1GXS3_9GAMM|nr:molybdopterin converting factor subunit 1 [Pelagibaculum spongiae]PVZ71586.1 molybdopterin converting factor subunit 1 [Pelagibaculum spongiae]
MIKVLFFARYREALGCESVEMPAVDDLTVALLKTQLSEQGEKWSQVLSESRGLVAVNQQMVKDSHLIKSGDEVAFFPPVTGG